MSAVAAALRENRKPKLAELLVQTLRRQIAAGEFAMRRKLPTESQLSAAFGVSRTVVREAIAALAADGLVHARQGAGIFVTAGPAAAFTAIGADRSDRISAAINVLEVRMGLEIEAAGLAALRRSASQEAAILEAFNDFDRLLAGAAPTGKADFALHRAIAAATNNPFYVEVLDGLGGRTIPCDVASPWGTEAVLSHEYQAGLQREHDAIVTAIAAQDAETARAAMRTHLLNSQQRYRARLRDPSPLRSLP